MSKSSCILNFPERRNIVESRDAKACNEWLNRNNSYREEAARWSEKGPQYIDKVSESMDKMKVAMSTAIAIFESIVKKSENHKEEK